MKEAIPELDINDRVKANIDLVFGTFLDEKGYFRENVSSNPEDNDTFEGRVVRSQKIEICF